MEYFLQMIKMVDKSHIYVPIYNVILFYIFLLVLPLVENIHFVVYQTATYLELQLIDFNWVRPLSLAKLYPSLFIFMSKLEYQNVEKSWNRAEFALKVESALKLSI